MPYEGMRNASHILKLIRTKKSRFWERERERRALALFHETAHRVPAYKDFLRKARVNPAKIKTFVDFQLVPPTSKKTYLREYPLEKVSWDGTLKKPLVFTSTSGSTGEPFYFPRGEQLDWEYSVLAEMFLQNSSYQSGGPVLVIIGFGMGVWIGGLITYKAFEIASLRGLPVSLITPGINKAEIFHAFRALSPHYRETIFIGYPPFVKDIIDEAGSQGINLKKIHLRVFSAAEAYTEKFRDYLVRKGGIKNPYLDTLNIYGTADIGAMAWETPTAILMRRLATRNQRSFQEIFSHIHKTPTLAQYHPLFITFEAPEGEILLTGNNAVPLIRYAIGDHGGVFNFDEATEKMKRYGVSLAHEARAVGIPYLSQLPFVYVYERIDFSVSLYGLQIYPEHVRGVLLETPFDKILTGKFTMLTKFDRRHNEYIDSHLELKKGKKASVRFKTQLLHAIVTNLRLKNSEYRELSNYLGERAYPRLLFWPAEHPLHFKPGVKQKWVKK